jgi:flavin reductase (DIM6/NTAB) family NADH-FMN oxidoreductase RutF
MTVLVPKTAMTSDRFFDFATLTAKDLYKLLLSTIVPRPIAWIVTLKCDGHLNAAPFSFFNAFAIDHPVVVAEFGVRD